MIEYALLAVAPTLSVAVTVKLKVPVAVGVPENTPAVKVMPVGIVPVLTEKVTAPVPPVAAMVWL